MSSPIRDQILSAVRDGGGRQVAHRIKTEVVVQRFQERRGEHTSLTVSSRYGQIEMFNVVSRELEGNPYVDIWTSDNVEGPPQVRIFNPPTLARDPEGDIDIDGIKYREDPLSAVAEVILGDKGR